MLQKKREKKNKTKLLQWDSHTQCKSAEVAKQRLYFFLKCRLYIKLFNFFFFLHIIRIVSVQSICIDFSKAVQQICLCSRT
jgi:hypothetical protein